MKAVAAAILALALPFLSAPVAQAKISGPKVCALFDQYGVNDTTMKAMLKAGVERGFTPGEIAQDLVEAVQGSCPDKLPEITEWAKKPWEKSGAIT